MSYGPINNSLDFMQEIPHFFNPATGREEPIDGAGPIGTYRGGAEMEPIGTYKGGAVAVPLPYEDSPDFSVPLPYEGSPDFSVPLPQTTSGEERSSLPFLENFTKENIATNYNDLKGWEKDILQCGLAVRSGSSWDKELCRLQNLYPGFMPRV